VRNEKTLIALLRGLVDLLAEESAQNPEFASKIERLLSDLPKKKTIKKVPVAKKPTREPFPDVHAEWNVRGETRFRLWMREQPIPVLRAIIRAQDLDPTRRKSWPSSLLITSAFGCRGDLLLSEERGQNDRETLRD
jgi:hypothetical protein